MEGVEHWSYKTPRFIVYYKKDGEDHVRNIECLHIGYDRVLHEEIVKIPKRLLKIADVEKTYANLP
jgi:hypothetical protein